MHPTWWLLVIGAAAALASIAFNGYRASPAQAALLGAGFATMLALSCLIHEAGHVLAGLRLGFEPVAIQMFWMGAATVHKRRATAPLSRAIGAAAGPAANLLVAALVTAAALIQGNADVALAGLAFAALNVAYAAINLLPTYPQDGGQIVHAALWALTGNEKRGLRLTGVVGLAFAAGLFALGAYVATHVALGGALVVLQGIFVALTSARALAQR